MEIRCGGCKKLFRIPDEKITGKGIKFSCTRCRETIKVTKEEFEHYTLSKSAVAVLDLLEEKPKSAPAQEPTAEKKVSEEPVHSLIAETHVETASHDHHAEAEMQPAEEHRQMPEFASVPVQKEFEHIPSPALDIPLEEQARQTAEREPSAAQAALEPASEPAPPAEPSASGLPSEQVHSTESSIPEFKSEPTQLQEPVEGLKEPEPEKEQMPLPQPQPSQPEPKEEKTQTATAEPAPALKPAVSEQIVEPQPEKEQIQKPAHPARPMEMAHATSVTPSLPRHEPASHATAATHIRSVPVAPEAPSRSVNMFLVYSVMLIIIGLVGYGVYTYIGPRAQKTDDLLKELSSTEGLRIASATGSVDSNGDLLIECVIENSLDKERPAWYVVVDIYNAQGSMLGKIRSVNGKQLFTQRDYDVMSKRGMNIQDLKAKDLVDQGITIPPKGSVTFQLRYVQPISGVSSFNATVNPFDPVRLIKELAEEIQ